MNHVVHSESETKVPEHKRCNRYTLYKLALGKLKGLLLMKLDYKSNKISFRQFVKWYQSTFSLSFLFLFDFSSGLTLSRTIWLLQSRFYLMESQFQSDLRLHLSPIVL